MKYLTVCTRGDVFETGVLLKQGFWNTFNWYDCTTVPPVLLTVHVKFPASSGWAFLRVRTEVTPKVKFLSKKHATCSWKCLVTLVSSLTVSPSYWRGRPSGSYTYKFNSVASEDSLFSWRIYEMNCGCNGFRGSVCYRYVQYLASFCFVQYTISCYASGGLIVWLGVDGVGRIGVIYLYSPESLNLVFLINNAPLGKGTYLQ